jgi:primosomal protein N'
MGLVPATDNRPGENAICPGDIITTLDGTTVEVLNTDAEGRLILCDALSFAKKYDPSLVIDFATLTGAAAGALSSYGCAIMGTAADSIKNEILDEKCIVISTPGAQPISKNGYSAVVILNALAFFSHDDLCAGERAREMLFETCGLVKKDGQILIAIDDAHPIIGAITQWNPATMIQRELREREELGLPPFEKSAYLRVSSEEATLLVSGLRSSIASGRLNSTISILGPVELGNAESKIILRFNEKDHESTAIFLRELQRKRGIAKKPLLYIRITPYSLA